MNDLANLLEAATNFIAILGTTKFMILVFILLFFSYFYELHNTKKTRFYFDEMKALNKTTIERLADENRRYRDIYLTKLGLTPDELNNITSNHRKEK